MYLRVNESMCKVVPSYRVAPTLVNFQFHCEFISRPPPFSEYSIPLNYTSKVYVY